MSKKSRVSLPSSSSSSSFFETSHQKKKTRKHESRSDTKGCVWTASKGIPKHGHLRGRCTCQKSAPYSATRCLSIGRVVWPSPFFLRFSIVRANGTGGKRGRGPHVFFFRLFLFFLIVLHQGRRVFPSAVFAFFFPLTEGKEEKGKKGKGGWENQRGGAMTRDSTHHTSCTSPSDPRAARAWATSLLPAAPRVSFARSS